MRILDETQEALFRNERNLLNDLRVTLAQIGTSIEDQESLANSINQLEEIFLLVVVGEFNAGKSAFINALLGQNVLKEGVTPTTTQINVLHFGDTIETRIQNANLHFLYFPNPLLQEISIVDTPGTNAVVREHEQITTEFIPRSDLVLFVTSADRPFTESENIFLHRIHDWGKKVVFIINKIDIIESKDELEQITQYVSENAYNSLNIHPEIFPVSARLALRAKMGEPALWEPSQFEALENFIRITLDEKKRIQLKLLNPIGVGYYLVKRYLDITQNRLDLLKKDLAMIDDVNSQLSIFHDDMMRDFNYRMADIENILLEMEQKGDDFFEETFRLARVIDLLKKDKLQKEFENTVVKDIPQRIERKVDELVNWLVEANLQQWQAVHNHLDQQRREYQSRIVGDAGSGTFNYDREKLIDSVGQKTQNAIDSFNKEEEARLIAQGAQEAVAASAAIEVGAIGLGTLITALATTAAADATGILLASLLAAIGLFVIPAKRRQAKNELRQKVADLRIKLINSLRSQFQREIDHGIQDINEAIAPYTRFVRAEKSKLDNTRQQLEKHKSELERLEAVIHSI